MKKIVITALMMALSLALFSACAESDKAKSTPDEVYTRPATGDEPTIPSEEFRPLNDFVGTYRNDDYTAQITKDKNEELSVKITSAVRDGESFEWTMSGFLSNINYKVHFDNAVKTVITYNSEGKETNRETAYENGSGRLVFNDNKAFSWYNGMESIENTEFTRAN